VAANKVSSNSTKTTNRKEKEKIMAAIPVTLVGTEYDPTSASGAAGKPVTIVGEIHLTGLGVGGGPMPPLSIWPGPGKPTHPIYYPPHIWGGGNEPFPTPPIVIPPPPTPPYPDPPAEGTKPPPPEGGWGYSPEHGWGYFPGTGPVPGPKAAKK
jgi:hypothetical protein